MSLAKQSARHDGNFKMHTESFISRETDQIAFLHKSVSIYSCQSPFLCPGNIWLSKLISRSEECWLIARTCDRLDSLNAILIIQLIIYLDPDNRWDKNRQGNEED